ncbi:MAG: DUF1819 family protein [Bacteroidota bacterium]
MTENHTYDFSYTGFSLRLTETLKVAKAKRENGEFNAVTEIGGGKVSTTKKFLQEINKRLEALTDEQLGLLIDGDLITQKQMAFLAVCKVHHFIRDFCVEVFREKMLVFDYEITEGDYISFFRRKSDLHPEMEELTESSQKKIRQVTFKMLEQAGLIDDVKTRMIQPQFLHWQVRGAIAADDINFLKIFLTSDKDIANVSL